MGLGLISIYQSIIDLVKSISTLGIETAGIKEIASSKNKEDLILNVSAIHRTITALACFGALICICFCYLISIWAFDSDRYVIQIALLSISIFFSIKSAGEILILQGMQKVSLIVKSTIVWNILSLIISIPLYYFFKINGIVAAFIIISIVTYLVTYYFRKKIDLAFRSVDKSILIQKGKRLIKIGIFLLLTTIQAQLTLFILKSFTIDILGLFWLGLVQATWTITNVYITLILSAMGSDFYPRLSSIIDNNIQVRRLVNEQIHFILLVAVPAVILLLLCSKFILTLLYSNSFQIAATLLHWILIGSFLKAISWAFGFILICKNRGLLFLGSDTLFSIIYLAISYIYIPTLGIEAIGIGYVIAYFVYLIVVYLLSRRISNFRLKNYNLKVGFVSLLLIIVSFTNIHYQTSYSLYIVGILSMLSISYSIYNLNKLFPLRSIYKSLKNK